MKGRPVTIETAKIGDKVAYNEDGKEFNKTNYTRIKFNEVVYGIVVSLDAISLKIVTLDLYNHKGIKV